MNENVQKDLVLSINEYAYVEDETKGHVVCWVGPSKTSLSQSDKLVRFDTEYKRFIPCSYKDAINLFTTIPENWYAILKNPAEDNRHPKPGTSNTLPDVMNVGQKINVRGPASFALYPSQMAKVVRGHALRSNQYLLARVYEADAANANRGVMYDAQGQEVETDKSALVNGQILVIKGTEVSFYIPPTGIEVIPVNNNDDNGYIRNAVTLERLEYCILKDEDGNKRYVHGPAVVFPLPTETFVTSPKGGYIFRAIELSKITGIYVKVIAEYEENGINHPIGEELFITGEDQMIYYPRPEHAIISYDNKLVHHAVAIPKGEGRYVMNRMTGDIKTIKGPRMYLPDPRTEVVVKRKLSQKECSLWYPGNTDALTYNIGLNEKSVEKSLRKGTTADNMAYGILNEVTAYSTASSDITLANLETNANIARGTSYTKPRTITLDNRFEGVVTVDVWTGYAVNVISKDGTRQVVCGPQTVMLDYDQTLEELTMSTGKPKSTDNLIHTVFLRHENNKVTDIVTVETADFVSCRIKLSYDISFSKNYQDKWFTVNNYVKFACDRMRSILKGVVKQYTIDEFHADYVNIIRNAAIKYTPDKKDTDEWGRFFIENGMYIFDCEVLDLGIENHIADMLEVHQNDMIKQSLALSVADKRVHIAEKLAEAEQKENEVKTQKLVNKMNLQREEALRELEIHSEVNRMKEAEASAAKQAEKDMQVILDEIQAAELKRQDNEAQQILRRKEAEAAIEKARQDAYAETVAKIMQSVSPGLIEALTSNANVDLANGLTQAIAPYAIAGDNESVADVANKMLRGTPLEAVLHKYLTNSENN